ncbi:hypothetical protein [Streptomyces sp. NPDC088752]|uniref:hypothetical protein n=1 Tax=Streptomyces sp. NPDC088752 TaxID=3154963 RepID=UPI0034148B79
MPVSIAHTHLAATGTCPTCSGSFETCRCGARPGLAVRVSIAKEIARDMERDDNGRGYEREPEARFHALLKDLVADGDRRAHKTGRPARRTLDQMVPGNERREFLTLPMRGAEDACEICGFWRCRCAASLTPVSVLAGAGAGSVREG